MDKRILYGCLAALGLLLSVDLLGKFAGWRLDVPLQTAFGLIVVGDVITTFVAMVLGGWVARRNFRWVAVALSALLWIATIAMLQLMATPGGVATAPPLMGIVKFNALAMVLSLVASWLGAALGERLAATRRRIPAT